MHNSLQTKEISQCIQPVYIARAVKIKNFEILFDKEDVTPNYRIWETVNPTKNLSENTSMGE